MSHDASLMGPVGTSNRQVMSSLLRPLRRPCQGSELSTATLRVQFGAFKVFSFVIRDRNDSVLLRCISVHTCSRSYFVFNSLAVFSWLSFLLFLVLPHKWAVVKIFWQDRYKSTTASKKEAHEYFSRLYFCEEQRKWMKVSLEKPGDHLYRQHICASSFFLLVSVVLRDGIYFCSTSLAPLNRLNYMIILNKL